MLNTKVIRELVKRAQLLWHVQKFCETCTTAGKRAQHLWHKHNISETCTHRILENIGWGRWNTLYPYIHIYIYMQGMSTYNILIYIYIYDHLCTNVYKYVYLYIYICDYMCIYYIYIYILYIYRYYIYHTYVWHRFFLTWEWVDSLPRWNGRRKRRISPGGFHQLKNGDPVRNAVDMIEIISYHIIYL